MTNILLTLLASLAVGMLFLKLKVPGGVLVGGIIGTTILSMTTGMAEMPFTARLIAQIIAGAFIGSSVDRDDLKKMKTIYKPFLLVIASLVVVNLVAGTLVYKFGPLDRLTSFMCCVPGGMGDTPLIASELGAEMPPVVIMQFVRMVVGIGVFPSLIMFVTKDEGETVVEKSASDEPKKKQKTSSVSMTVGTLLLAGVFGVIGRKLGVPSGALLFAIITILVLKLAGVPIVYPKWIKRAAQVLSGAYIGCSVGLDTLYMLPHLIIPAVIIIGIYMINAFITGNIIHRVCGISKRESMLMVTPAGATDMALISADIGVNSPNLIVLQIVRMLTVISIFPNMDLMIVNMLDG
ncbi:MAG: AbrB family transcriptional regulator [Lachnospiraceae bacterium]|nr:AbrB family transcriptional regulator [Lachnospiraceae bacterium]